jgi:hypothetical protein
MTRTSTAFECSPDGQELTRDMRVCWKPVAPIDGEHPRRTHTLAQRVDELQGDDIRTEFVRCSQRANQSPGADSERAALSDICIHISDKA